MYFSGVVNDSATISVAQPTVLEDGSVVSTYDWQEYSQFCTKVKGVKKLVFIYIAWLHLCKGESRINRKDMHTSGQELEA